MAKSILPKGVAAARFKGIDINVKMTEWTDSRRPRLALHSFLKRDGGLVEPMGREQFRCKMILVYVGETFAEEFKELAKSVDDDPKGTLSHPLFGDMQVACEGFEGATLNIENGKNLYTVPVSFVEDNVDQKLANQLTGVAAQQQTVENTSNNLLTKITQFASAATAIVNLANAAVSFSTSAFQSQSSFAFTPGLSTALQNLNTLTADAVTAIKDDPASIPEPKCYDTIVLCEQLYDACVQMLSAISVAKPRLITFIMPLQMHIANLAVRLYGADGRARIDEIMSLNPGKIPNPACIPPGTSLLVSQPTAPQT